jgi:hypothetical protein
MRTARPVALLLALSLLSAPLAMPGSAVALDASAVLPDLGMLPPTDFSIQSRPRGVRWLRFDSVVVNVGPGLFDVYGHGPADASGMLPVTQRVQDGAGGWTEVATPARMFFAGDGHNHWHVEELQDWTIASVNDRATPLSRGAKTGFCFWDNYDYSATGPIKYHPSTTSACMQRADGTVPMGLSVGWGDEYPSSIAFQYIDITGLPNGEYVVTLEADLDHEFVEADADNNTGWATIRISRKSVTVLATGTDLDAAGQ